MAFAKKRQTTEKNASNEETFADSFIRGNAQCMDTMNETTKGPGSGILTGTFRALDCAVRASLAMVAADRATNAAFDAYFPSGGRAERDAYAAASDAAEAARESFIDATAALCSAVDTAPRRDHRGRFVRDQGIAVGELLHAIASNGDDDTRRAVSFLRFRA